ncbi:MAG: tetratricopeptide repeat protein, partial [bacterium]
VVAVLIGGGLFSFVNQQRETRAQAAGELEEIQQTLAAAEPSEATGQLRDFLAQYAGTPYAVEARLVLAELLLEEGRASDAVTTLTEVAPSFRDPLRLQATILLAAAYEEAEDWEAAADVYGELRERAEFAFQRRDAAEGLARAHLARGDTTAAASVYREVLAELEEDSEERSYFEMRLAELAADSPS